MTYRKQSKPAQKPPRVWPWRDAPTAKPRPTDAVDAVIAEVGLASERRAAVATFASGAVLTVMAICALLVLASEVLP